MTEDREDRRRRRMSKANPDKDGNDRPKVRKELSRKAADQRAPRARRSVVKISPETKRQMTKVVADYVRKGPATPPPVFARAVDLSAMAAQRPKVDVTPEGPLTPGDWRLTCMIDADGRCAVTGEQAPHWDHPGWQVHHVVGKSQLRDRGLGAWVWDRRIGMVLTRDVHAWFDDASQREIPRELVRRETWELAAEIDEHLGTTWATTWILDRYPLVGAVRLAELRTYRPMEDTP